MIIAPQAPAPTARAAKRIRLVHGMGDGRGRGVRAPPDPGEGEPREEDRDERVPRILPRVERGEEQAREDHAEDRLEHAADGELLAHTGRDCGRDRTHGGQHPGKELAVGRLVRDGPAERMPDDGDGPVKEPEDHDQHHGHAEREEHLPGRGTDEGKPVERLGKVPADEEPDHQERSVDDEEEGVGLGPREVTRALAEVPAPEEVLGEEGRRAVHDQGHGRDQAEREHEHERDRLHERGGVERHEAREPPAERREKPDERGEAEERPEPEEGQHCRCDSGGSIPASIAPGGTIARTPSASETRTRDPTIPSRSTAVRYRRGRESSARYAAMASSTNGATWAAPAKMRMSSLKGSGLERRRSTTTTAAPIVPMRSPRYPVRSGDGTTSAAGEGSSGSIVGVVGRDISLFSCSPARSSGCDAEKTGGNAGEGEPQMKCDGKCG